MPKKLSKNVNANGLRGGSVYAKRVGTRAIIQLTISRGLQHDHGFEKMEYIMFRFDEKKRTLHAKFVKADQEGAFKVFRNAGTVYYQITALLRKHGLELSKAMKREKFEVENGEVVIDLSHHTRKFQEFLPERKRHGAQLAPYTKKDRAEVEKIVQEHINRIA